jgi:AraC-like DNA-binding protein
MAGPDPEADDVGGVRYRERPSASVPGVVVWSRPVRGSIEPLSPPARVLPDGCIDLIWTAGRVLVAGPDTRAVLVPPVPGVGYVGVRLPPGVGPAVLGVPAHALRDRRVPLAEVWTRPASWHPGPAWLEDRLAASADPGRLLEALVRDRLREGDGADERGATLHPDAALLPAVAALRRGASVAAVARSVGLGERQLHRRSLVSFGYGPKTLARILRLGQALDLARAGLPWSTVAAVAGYSDQPHLARDVRAITGVPLAALLAESAGGPPG